MNLNLKIKIMKSKVFGLIVFVIALTFGLELNAQPHHKFKKHAAFKEVHEYVETTVFPVLAEERANFNEKLSSSEIDQINLLIVRLDSLRQEFANSELDFEPGPPPLLDEDSADCEFGEFGHKALTDEEKEQIKEFRVKLKEIMSEAKEISENHLTEIEEIMTGLEPQKEIWKEEIEKILTDNGIDIDAIEAHSVKMHKDMQDDVCDSLPGEKMNPFERMFLPHVFLLMDFTANKTKNKTSEIASIELHPNPATDFITLDYEIKADTKITIKILNNTGNELQTIVNEDTKVGTYSKQVDISDFEKGIYFINIKSDKGFITRMLLIEE